MSRLAPKQNRELEARHGLHLKWAAYALDQPGHTAVWMDRKPGAFPRAIKQAEKLAKLLTPSMGVVVYGPSGVDRAVVFRSGWVWSAEVERLN